MTTKQIENSLYAPDGSLYITLTDGDGNLVSVSGVASGAGSSVNLTADTNITAGTGVSINDYGHIVQTWGPAPQLAGTATIPDLVDGTAILILSPSKFLIFNIGTGVYAGSITSNVVTTGTIDTSVQSANVTTNVQKPIQSFANAVGLSSSLAILAYNDPDTGYASVGALSVSGTTITAGTAAQITTQGFQSSFLGYPVSIVKLSATSFAVVAQYADNTINVVIGTVSGTTITLGSLTQITSVGANNAVDAIGLSSTDLIAAFFDVNTSNEAGVVIISVSGTTATVGTPQYITGSTGAGIQIINPTGNLVVLYTDQALPSSSGEPNSSNYVACTLTGSTLGSFGTTTTVTPFSYSDFRSKQVVAFGSKFIATAGSATFPTIGTIDGFQNITFNSTVGIPPGTGLGFSSQASNNYPPISPYSYNLIFGTIAVLSNTMVMFSDTNFSIYEMDDTGIISSALQHDFLLSYWLYPLDATHALATFSNINQEFGMRVIEVNPITVAGPIGFSSAAITAGNTGTINLLGLVAGFSGLNPGTIYYYNGDGTLITANTGYQAGIAISSTELLIAS